MGQIGGWGEAACVRTTFLTMRTEMPPSAACLADGDDVSRDAKVRGPRLPASVAQLCGCNLARAHPPPTNRQMAWDIAAFGALLIELCTLQTSYPADDTLLATSQHIAWEPLKVLSQRCILEDPEERPAATLLEDLMAKLVADDAWPDYFNASPSRLIKRSGSRLVFDASTRVSHATEGWTAAWSVAELKALTFEFDSPLHPLPAKSQVRKLPNSPQS